MDDALPTVPGYRFEAKLAEGGMGVVYRAVDETLGRTVAIKMIRSALLGRGDEEEETVARFLREARAAAQIRSNHVAHVLQFGRTESGDLFLVLEYLDGITLAALLRKEKRLSVERAVRITRQICRGMEAAHQLGIVHRDLKPSNVMLVNQDGDPEFVKILDFGVAKVVGERESGVTRAGMLVGTYTCMAPEQVTNETIDARTDVYALAVMLFRLLTGKPLFEGQDVTAVLFHHVHTPPPAPSKVAPDANIPPALDALVLRCLEKQPARRPRSMADFDRALGLSLEIRDDADAVPQQAPTALSDPHLRARASLASRDATEEQPDDDEVFSESGSIRSLVDTSAETQITDSSSRSRVPPAGDPPTPHTSTSAKEPVSLAPVSLHSEEAVASSPAVRRPTPSKKPLIAAAVAGVVLLLVVAIAVVLSSGSDAGDEVIVVVSPAAVEPSAPPPAPPADENPTAAAKPEGEASPPDAEAAAEPSAPSAEQDGPASSEASADPAVAEPPREVPAAAAPTSPPPVRAEPAATPPRPRQKPAEERATTTQADADKKRRAVRKKAEEPKADKNETSGEGDKKPRPRFIRVHTGDADG